MEKAKVAVFIGSASDEATVAPCADILKKLGIPFIHDPIRGGTDGATFSFMGCPTPNLGTGSYNHHGRFEYLSVREFREMITIVKEIVKA